MSADRIDICPKCKENEWREWHDMGVGENGKFLVEFRGVCYFCDFEWKYTHSEMIIKNRIKTLDQTYEGCPSQWEGTMENGDSIYIRYRWGGLSVDINGENIFNKSVGDTLDGFIELDKVLELTGLEMEK